MRDPDREVYEVEYQHVSIVPDVPGSRVRVIYPTRERAAKNVAALDKEKRSDPPDAIIE